MGRWSTGGASGDLVVVELIVLAGYLVVTKQFLAVTGDFDRMNFTNEK